MVFGINLPDWKSSLQESFRDYVAQPLETKSQEFKTLLESNIAFGQRTQQALIALALGIFLLLAIAYFWKDN